MNNQFCNDCRKLTGGDCGQHVNIAEPPNPKDSWQERFGVMFQICESGIKSFIEDEIKLARESEREKIIERIEAFKGGTEALKNYDSGLERAIKIIKSGALPTNLQDKDDPN